MKHAVKAAIAAVALTLGLAQPGQADFNARFDMRVSPVNAAVFEAYGSSAASADRYWCAAADYARRALGAPWTARIHLVRGRGPGVSVNKRTTVHFTLDPVAAGVEPADPGIVTLPLRVGTSRSVQSAFQDCDRPPVRF